MRWSSDDVAFQFIAGLVIVAVIAAAVTMTAGTARAKRACRDRHGVVIEHDCTTIVQCTGVPQSSTATCHPVRFCDWRCETRPVIDASGWQIIEAP